jgi:hypothetical protein
MGQQLTQRDRTQRSCLRKIASDGVVDRQFTVLLKQQNRECGHLLESDAAWKTEADVIETRYSRSAEPTPTLATIWPSTITDTIAPGRSGAFQGSSNLFTAAT